MIKVKDECVGCPPEMGCYGSSCPNRNVRHYYCYECGEEIDEDYLIGEANLELCEECAETIAETWWGNLTLSEKLEYANGDR